MDVQDNAALLLDEVTAFYNKTVFQAFLQRAAAPQILPVSLVLIRVAPQNGNDIPQVLGELAGCMTDLMGANAMAARLETDTVALVLSHSEEADAYRFVERLAVRLEETDFWKRADASAVLQCWHSMIERPEECFDKAMQELHTVKRLSLRFVAQQGGGRL